MKSIGVMQPYIFPYLGYFQLINLVDKFIILDDVNFIKKGWINRNRVLDSHEKKPLLFTVPLKDASQNRHIKDTLIHETYDYWKTKFAESLKRTYQSAPNYESVCNLVIKVFNKFSAGDPISKLCVESLRAVTEYLQIPTQIQETSVTYNSQLKGQDRILEICLKEKANEYVNLIGGLELYSKQRFEVAGVKLKFHRIKEYRYDQGLKEFQPHLSIIDVLMFCPPLEIQELLKQCEII